MELQLVHLILFDKYLNFSIFSTFCNCSFSLNSHIFLWNIFLWPVDLSLAFILEQFLQDRGFFLSWVWLPEDISISFFIYFFKAYFRCSSDNCVHGSCCVVFYCPGSCHFCCKLPLFTQATKCFLHLATLNFFFLLVWIWSVLHRCWRLGFDLGHWETWETSRGIALWEISEYWDTTSKGIIDPFPDFPTPSPIFSMVTGNWLTHHWFLLYFHYDAGCIVAFIVYVFLESELLKCVD